MIRLVGGTMQGAQKQHNTELRQREREYEQQM